MIISYNFLKYLIAKKKKIPLLAQLRNMILFYVHSMS